MFQLCALHVSCVHICNFRATTLRSLCTTPVLHGCFSLASQLRRANARVLPDASTSQESSSEPISKFRGPLLLALDKKCRMVLSWRNFASIDAAGPYTCLGPGLWNLPMLCLASADRQHLYCYLVGSLDLNFLIRLIFPFNQQNVKLFARGSTATKSFHVFLPCSPKV